MPNIKLPDGKSLNFKNKVTGLCETNWLTPMKVRELNITTTKCYVKLNYLTLFLSGVIVAHIIPTPIFFIALAQSIVI